MAQYGRLVSIRSSSPKKVQNTITTTTTTATIFLHPSSRTNTKKIDTKKVSSPTNHLMFELFSSSGLIKEYMFWVDSYPLHPKSKKVVVSDETCMYLPVLLLPGILRCGIPIYYFANGTSELLELTSIIL